jgi:RNA polymerase sigma factor (sigma-70 family)
MNGTKLLESYRSTGSETAFAELLQRYTNMVYSVAKRRVSDQSLAEEVTQTVFIRLAKSPPKLTHDGELASWLHRTAIHVAIDVWRSETRRRTREQQSVAMQSPTTEEAKVWEDITPHLDEALGKLSEEDRQALLLRFFERKPMRDVGSILGVSEDAAKMRVSRALNRLRGQLVPHGIACSVAALGLVVTARSVEAAPANLVGRIVSASRVFRGAHTTSFLRAGALRIAGAVTLAVAVALLFVASGGGDADAGAATQSAVQEPSTPGEPLARGGRNSAGVFTASALVSEKIHMRLQVVAGDTGQGLRGAEVQAAYYYAGGRGEGHELVTDSNGDAFIPKAKEGGNPGMNVFVSIAGYVPVAIGFGRVVPSDYVLNLQPAALVAGVVVDEEGQPVSGVRLEASPREDHKDDQPNTDFQTTRVETDSAGLFQYPYLPQSYPEVRFTLTREGYAPTDVEMPVGKPESLTATLVIKRGFSVSGRVTDDQGFPIPGATIRDLPKIGYRRRTTETDSKGEFLLRGISNQYSSTAEVTVEAKGRTPQLRKVELIQTNETANFSLSKATPLRGRVVDPSGQPLAGVACRTDTDDRGRRPFWWSTHTDAEGRFEWDSAPAEPTLFWFELDGYEVIRDRSLQVGSDHMITLVPKAD